MHQRLVPRRYGFRHGTFTCAFDLDEIDALDRQIPLFSRNRPNLFAFYDRDHLTLPGLEGAGVRANLSAWLATQGVALPADARVTLVTLPRMFGYVFNPVSFYFCHARDGAPICAVAEVSNTFGEMKPYLVPVRGAGFGARVPKHFYVSPFSSLDLEFAFHLQAPGERLACGVDDWSGARCHLVTSLTGSARPLTGAALAWAAVRFPLHTLRVITLIHWHALQLWLRHVPWHGKAERPDAQRDLLRPHPSISPAPTAHSR